VDTALDQTLAATREDASIRALLDEVKGGG